ncbi:hypothetical protein TSUD_331260 [Trifolium subterraneum]|uniref:RRM domain-containing protein n=1 Tax=Trifolium subterraneum TaxID=3900 RepID=A0A2Z6LYP3_TRISU|nr:hypothetical protein TSUD_331260 [Trifolium subterraneum]
MKEMKDLKKKRKIDEAGSSNLDSKEEELRLLMEPLAKPVLVNLLSKLGSKDPAIAEEIETIAYADSVHRRIFVRDLSLNTTSKSLRNAFKEYGEIEEGKVVFDKHIRKSCRYGYILYKDVKSAKKALCEPSKLIDGRLTLCMLASDEVTRKISDTTQRKLFVGNLSPQVTNGTLYSYFKGHGDIEECSVAYERHKDSNASRGFGFVTYKTAEAAGKALVDLHNKTLEGRHINVQYANPYKGKGGQSSAPPKAALPVPPRYVEGYPREGGGGQSSVPPTAALPVPPGYTYPQTAAPPYPYPQTAPPSYPYPQTAAPYAASHYPSLRPGPSTSRTYGYGQNPYPPNYYQNQ